MAQDSSVQEHHRPGAFKQQNKAHKTGRHKSKGALNSINKGKTNAKTSTKKIRREQRKEDRRNQAAQLRQKKRDEVLMKKRSLGTVHTAPILVAVVALGEDINPNIARDLLTSADVESVVSVSTERNLHINVQRFKQRFTFAFPRVGDLYGTLDSLKVADAVLFLVSTNTGIEDFAETILTAAIAQRLPTPLVAVTNLENLPLKRRHEAKQNIQDAVSRWIPSEKVVSMGTSAETLAIIRKLGGQKRRDIVQRDKRSNLIAEAVKFVADQQQEVGTLVVDGFLRGQPLSANSLVYLPGLGTYQMSLIETLTDPYAAGSGKDCAVLEQFRPDPTKQVSLETENPVDPMDAEQTWPTAEELAEAEAGAGAARKRTKKVPRGTSDYQAAWIPDPGEEEDDDPDSDSGSGSEAGMEVEEAGGSEDEDEGEEGTGEEDEEESAEGEPDADRYDQRTDLEEEMRALRERDKERAAREDAAFPDEMDTPREVPARQRFHKYRGLESLRTSTWDPMENLPPDYARIFQFENYDRSRRKALKDREEEGEGDNSVPTGRYLRVHVSCVPRDVFEEWRVQSAPLALFSLLPHEQRMSVLNLVLRSAADTPIRGKETLVFHVGQRRFRARPIFSQHTGGRVHKLERFWRPGATVVASVMAPVAFRPCSVVVFREGKDEAQEVVGSGEVLSADPCRVVCKRVVLSGHPFKIHKRSAVVRFMFFNREDVAWFRPVELRTRHGRRGHIREPLGTHGHMKCVFDTQLKSQDTVFLRLYKRVFPPWSHEEVTTAPLPIHE